MNVRGPVCTSPQPLMTGSSIADLETPALCLNLAVLEQQSQQLASCCRAAGKAWCPDTVWHGIPQLAAAQLKLGAAGIACAGARAACELLHDCARAESLICRLCRPPVHPQEWTSFEQLLARAQVSVICDHYAQAEAISLRTIASGKRVPILVELNLGQPRFGVRAGWDALHLAKGIDQLPGCEVRGLSANLCSLRATSADSHRAMQSAFDLLAETQGQFLQAGINCSEVSVAVDEVTQPVLECSLITDLRTGLGAGVETTGSTEPLLTVVATVFSRTRLEQAVLDCGQMHLGAADSQALRVIRTVRGRPLPDAEITCIDWTSCTLDLGPRSRDLIIGDGVEAIPRHAPLTLRLFRTLNAVRNGVVEDCWSSAAHGHS